MEVWVWSVKVGGKRKNTPKTMSLVDQSAVGPRMSAKWKQDRYGRLGVAGKGSVSMCPMNPNLRRENMMSHGAKRQPWSTKL